MAYTVINKPSSYFNTVTYTGTGATQSITGLNFKPDWVWIKDRTVGFDHVLQDAVRGTTKIIDSNTTYAEFTNATSITSFNSDGFTTGSYVATNNSTTPFVSWNWLASNTTTSNTSGSITSTVSANTTSGFSIVSYTGNGTSGATIGHGLGAVPKFIIVKERSAVQQWINYHVSLGNTNYVHLNATDASASSSTVWNNTTPTSSVFTVGTAVNCNDNGGTFIAYCFAEVKGFSKFGSYTGNGSTDGTFVYTGFKPAFVIIKQTSSAGEGWEMGDNKRSTYNVITTFLRANSSAAESTNTDRQYDFVSNGIKMRGSHGSTNGSGSTYIYMCFAENPFVSATAIPTTAR